MNPHLRLAVTDGVATLALDRASKRNAFSQAMWEGFPKLVDQAMADPAVRVLVVASASGGAFCAGADIGEFATHASDPVWRARNNSAIRATQIALARAPKPTVALVEGDAIGGGLGLALACDMRVAHPAARFAITPAKLGLVYPLHDTKLLVDVVGPAQARRLLYTALQIDAAEALRIGLVQVVDAHPHAAVAVITDAIRRTSSHSQRASKAIIQRILDGVTDDDAASAGQFDAAFDGPDFAEGVAAFLGKRPAQFGA